MDDLKGKKGYWKLTEEAQIALCGELVLEEAMDLRKTDYGTNIKQLRGETDVNEKSQLK